MVKEEELSRQGISLDEGRERLERPVCLGNYEQFGEGEQVAGNEAAGRLGQIVKAQNRA